MERLIAWLQAHSDTSGIILAKNGNLSNLMVYLINKKDFIGAGIVSGLIKDLMGDKLISEPETLYKADKYLWLASGTVCYILKNGALYYEITGEQDVIFKEADGIKLISIDNLNRGWIVDNNDTVFIYSIDGKFFKKVNLNLENNILDLAPIYNDTWVLTSGKIYIIDNNYNISKTIDIPATATKLYTNQVVTAVLYDNSTKVLLLNSDGSTINDITFSHEIKKIVFDDTGINYLYSSGIDFSRFGGGGLTNALQLSGYQTNLNDMIYRDQHYVVSDDLNNTISMYSQDYQLENTIGNLSGTIIVYNNKLWIYNDTLTAINKTINGVVVIDNAEAVAPIRTRIKDTTCSADCPTACNAQTICEADCGIDTHSCLALCDGYDCGEYFVVSAKAYRDSCILDCTTVGYLSGPVFDAIDNPIKDSQHIYNRTIDEVPTNEYVKIWSI